MKSIGAVVGLLILLSGCGGTEDAKDADYAALRAEYRVAVESARDCVAEAGFIPTDITEDANGVGLNFGVYVEGDASDAERDQAPTALDACQAESGMEELYAELFALQIPTGSEREALWDEYVACLEKGGITVDELSLSMHPNHLVDYLINYSEGRWDMESDVDPNPIAANARSECMDKYHYSVFPTND